MTVVFPAQWRRARLLAYVRSEHPGETVRLLEWPTDVDQDLWQPRLWLCNPAAFADYERGVLADDGAAA